MKNLSMSILIFLMCSASFAQGFGQPPGRSWGQVQQPSYEEMFSPPTFIVIPMMRMSPELIALIMGGDVIWDESGMGRGSSGSGRSGGQGYSDHGDSGNSGNGRSGGSSRGSSRSSGYR